MQKQNVIFELLSNFFWRLDRETSYVVTFLIDNDFEGGIFPARVNFGDIFLVQRFFLRFFTNFGYFFLVKVKLEFEDFRESDSLEVNVTEVFACLLHDPFPVALLHSWVFEFNDEGNRSLETIDRLLKFDERMQTLRSYIHLD